MSQIGMIVAAGLFGFVLALLLVVLIGLWLTRHDDEEQSS